MRRFQHKALAVVLMLYLIVGIMQLPLWTIVLHAAVAFDQVSLNADEGTTTNWDHTPVGTPAGILVILSVTSSTDHINTVTYGGGAVAEVSCSPNAGQSRGAHVFFDGSGVPTGTQTVEVTEQGGAATVEYAAITLTGSADLEVVDCDATINTATYAGETVTLGVNGRTSWAAIVFQSGQGAVTGIAPLTGWSSREEVDYGSTTSGMYTLDTPTSSDITAGWAQTSAIGLGLTLAISEVQTTFGKAAILGLLRGGR